MSELVRRSRDVGNLIIGADGMLAPQDSATGGPDPIRGIYPVVATIGADGFTRLEGDDVAARTAALLARLERRDGR